MRPGASTRLASAAFLAVAVAGSGVADSSVETAAGAALSSLAISERADWSRYSGGRYVDHVYRESRAWLRGPAGGRFSGESYALAGSVQGSAASSREVKADAPLEVGLGRFSTVLSVSPGGFPSHRGLLAGAPDRLVPGTSWIGPATFAFSPRDGSTVELPVLVEYRVSGPSLLSGRETILVKALFAPRWQSSVSRNASVEASGLVSVSGRHELDLYLDAARGDLVLVRDRFDDSLQPSAGPVERRSGFILVFLQGGARPERRDEIAALAAATVPSSPQAVTPPPSAVAPPPSAVAPPPSAVAPPPSAVAPPPPATSPGAGPGPFIAGDTEGLDESTPPALAAAGVELVDTGPNLVLRVRDLRFVADGDEILASERWRLDAIGAALAALPGRSFLVEGHAASVGKPAGELELSARRARRVVEELVARGIEPSRLVWRGIGSTKPLAPNDNEAGRARNRRVEITVLE